MTKFEDLPNSKIDMLIDEYIHKERDRKLLHRRFVDGLTFERLAEEFDLSVRQTKQIIYKQGDKLLKYIDL